MTWGWGISNFPGFGSSGWGAVSYTPALATYALRTLFSDVTNQPVTLVNGQFLSDDDDGMESGQLVVGQDGTGVVSLTSNELKLDGETATAWTSAWCKTRQATTIQEGLTVYAKIRVITHTDSYGSAVVATTDGAIDSPWSGSTVITGLGVYATIGGAVERVLGGYGPPVTTLTSKASLNPDGENFEHALVFSTTEVAIYGRGADLDATNWTLLYVDEHAESSLYASYQSAADILGINSFQCDESLLNTGAITPIIHDTFSGSGTVEGRTPDTIDNGNTYEIIGWSGTDLTVSGGQLITASGAEAAAVECGESDVYIIANVEFGSATGTSDAVVFARMESTPTVANCVYARVENDNNLLVIAQIIAGTPTDTSVAYNPAEATPFDLHLVLNGTSAQAIAGSTVVSATVTDTNNTKHGPGARYGTSTIYSRANDFKVFTASGVTINV